MLSIMGVAVAFAVWAFALLVCVLDDIRVDCDGCVFSLFLASNRDLCAGLSQNSSKYTRLKTQIRIEILARSESPRGLPHVFQYSQLYSLADSLSVSSLPVET